MKRVLTIADLHCGHRAGLTPPEYQSAIPGRRYHKLQIDLWEAFASRIKKLQPIHTLIVVGDCVDGKGQRSGGSELITSDMRLQSEMAATALNTVKAEHTIMVYGTAYHSSPSGEDWEKLVADKIGARSIGDHEWISVNGLMFDVKHHIGGTSVAYGRNTQLEKAQLANLLWNEMDKGQPRGDVFIRGHVHHHHGCFEPHYLAMSLPALQGAATKFGGRVCTLPVHFGLVWFDVEDDGSYSWDRDIIHVTSQRAKAIKL